MATCSKLSLDKVRKTTIVGMDIKQSHIEAGLVHPQEHQVDCPGAGPALVGPRAGPTHTPALYFQGQGQRVF
jgi:hypothetical protein